MSPRRWPPSTRRGVSASSAVSGSDGDFSFVHALTREAVIARCRRPVTHHACAGGQSAGRRTDRSVVPRNLLAHVLGYHEQALRYAGTPRGWPSTAAYEDAAEMGTSGPPCLTPELADRAELEARRGRQCIPLTSSPAPARMYRAHPALSTRSQLDGLGRRSATKVNWRPGLADSKAADLLASALEACGTDADDPRHLSSRQLRPRAGIRRRTTRPRHQQPRDRPRPQGWRPGRRRMPGKPASGTVSPGDMRKPAGAFD